MANMDSALSGLVKAIARELATELRPLLVPQEKPAVKSPYIKPREAAAMMGRSPSCVRQWMADGRIPPSLVKEIGSRRALIRVEFERWLRAQ